jgi:hypothetical protein
MKFLNLRWHVLGETEKNCKIEALKLLKKYLDGNCSMDKKFLKIIVFITILDFNKTINLKRL